MPTSRACSGVQHIIAAVNKMDLVGFSQEVFERIAGEFREFAEQLGVKSLYAVPVSALEGDNVVRRSPRTPWFEGPALLEYLEGLRVSDTAAAGPLRFPVQYVIRPDSTFRGFAGQIASGVLRPGDDRGGAALGPEDESEIDRHLRRRIGAGRAGRVGERDARR